MARPCGKKAALSCLWRTGNTRLFTATVLLALGPLISAVGTTFNTAGNAEEARNTPFCPSQEKFHAVVVLRGLRNISDAP